MRDGDFPEVSYETWRQQVERELGEESFDSLRRRTPDGLELEPLYTARPGEPTEGLWRESSGTACSLVDEPDPAVARERIVNELAGGAGALWLRADRALRLGTGDVEAAEMGDGLVLDQGTDLAETLDGVGWLVDRDPTAAAADLWFDAGANALPLAALWLAHCERSALDPAAVRVHFGLDPLGALARDGELPRDLMRLSSEMAALARFSAEHLRWSTAATVSTLVYHEAGAGRVQELSFLVATLAEYLRWCGDSGLTAAEAAPQISLRIGVGARIFPEIAKLRAARRLWRATLGAFGVEAPPEIRMHVVGSRRPLSRREGALNVLRGTEQAFVALAGGADAVTLPRYDAVGEGAPVERARRLARNSALILSLEGGLSAVADPAAGSHYVEHLTSGLCRDAWVAAQEIERRGGLRKALLSGEIGASLAASAARRSAAFERGEFGITGVTHYRREEGAESRAPADSSPVDRALRRARHQSDWRAPESDATYSRHFVVEDLVAMARRGATIEEMGERLGGREGGERIEPLPLRRDATPFEERPKAGEEE